VFPFRYSRRAKKEPGRDLKVGGSHLAPLIRLSPLMLTRQYLKRQPHRRDRHQSQVSRLISIARLNTLLCLHLRPINPVISGKPSVPMRTSGGISHLEGSFALRCFQCLSLPNIATQQCPWRDNWYTIGSSTPVLSY
jgi:hypothetical protein